MKTKERYVWLVCTGCESPGRSRYTTHKRVKAAYKVEKRKYCKFCLEHAVHREKKL